jgi:hypothetical protein
MRTIYLIMLVMISFKLCSAQRLRNSAAYFKTPGRVGIYVATRIESPRHSSSGLGGLGGAIGGALDAAANAAINKNKTLDKFDTVLYKIDDRLNPEDTVLRVYELIYTLKGKTVVRLNDELDISSLPAFQSHDKAKKYSSVDVRSLKDKLQLDEVLVVFVEYGVKASYKYGMEISRNGRCEITSELVSTSDNSLAMQNTSFAYERVKGEWNVPPDYANLARTIKMAIRECIGREKLEYDKLGR